MTATEIGTELVKLCREGKNAQAIETYYSKDIKSVEAWAPAGKTRDSQGIEAILGKSKWWNDNHTVHSATVDGPFPFDDRFTVYFKYEMTPKMTGKKTTMEEVALYHVQNGKIIHEEFFYKTM
jgi:hypothetical protein